MQGQVETVDGDQGMGISGSSERSRSVNEIFMSVRVYQGSVSEWYVVRVQNGVHGNEPASQAEKIVYASDLSLFTTNLTGCLSALCDQRASLVHWSPSSVLRGTRDAAKWQNNRTWTRCVTKIQKRWALDSNFKERDAHHR